MPMSRKSLLTLESWLEIDSHGLEGEKGACCRWPKWHSGVVQRRIGEASPELARRMVDGDENEGSLP